MKLVAVYGIIATQALLVLDFEKVIAFDKDTLVFGVVAAKKSGNDFIYPEELDEAELSDQYQAYLKTLVAEAREFEGDLMTSSQLDAWENRLRRMEPRIMIGIQD